MIHSYSLYIYIKIIFLIKSILSFQQIKKMSMTFRNRVASLILFTLKDTKDTPYISPYNATRESCKLKKVTFTISTIFYPLINNILSTPLISPRSIENSKKNFISQVKIIPKPLERAARRITELRRVPKAIPFARYSTRLHRATRRAHSGHRMQMKTKMEGVYALPDRC